MKPHEEKLRTMLDDVLPPSADLCGPDRHNVLEMVRQERFRVRRIHGVATAAVLTIVVMAVLSVWTRPTSEPLPIAAADESSPIELQSINDEQLFALLQATPSALMEWPNGERTLLLVMEP